MSTTTIGIKLEEIAERITVSTIGITLHQGLRTTVSILLTPAPAQSWAPHALFSFAQACFFARQMVAQAGRRNQAERLPFMASRSLTPIVERRSETQVPSFAQPMAAQIGQRSQAEERILLIVSASPTLILERRWEPQARFFARPMVAQAGRRNQAEHGIRFAFG